MLTKLKVSNKTNINSDYYVTYIMKPLVENYLTSMYSNDINKVFIHHDAAASHTSKFNTEELKKLEDIYGVQFISKKKYP
jgi:type II restriction/modification system DNA methylase subunit YeeA